MKLSSIGWTMNLDDKHMASNVQLPDFDIAADNAEEVLDKTIELLNYQMKHTIDKAMKEQT